MKKQNSTHNTSRNAIKTGIIAGNVSCNFENFYFIVWHKKECFMAKIDNNLSLPNVPCGTVECSLCVKYFCKFNVQFCYAHSWPDEDVPKEKVDIFKTTTNNERV